MSDNGNHFYESMFILDARSAKKDYDSLQAELTQILNKHGVEVAQTHIWGERRLAYEIRHQKKGFYQVMHLMADPSSLDALKRDLTLFEPLLRQFYLRIESIPEKFEFPAEPEDRRDIRGGRKDDFRGRGRERDRDRDRDREDRSRPDAAIPGDSVEEKPVEEGDSGEAGQEQPPDTAPEHSDDAEAPEIQAVDPETKNVAGTPVSEVSPSVKPAPTGDLGPEEES